MAGASNRGVVDGVLSPELCAELRFIQTSLGVRGYRPHVTSVTLHDLVAADPAFLVPVVEARRRIWEATEKALGRELELQPEFTGLLTWHPGAAIGWHHDSNRPYLKQREVAAVAYLNTQGEHFTGGTFRFQAQEPTVHPAAGAVTCASAGVAPVMGRLIAYTAGPENTHCVDPVEAGCRPTLVMWFTTDPAFREDDSVLRALLAACSTQGCRPAAAACGGLPDTMYLDEDGSDLRVAFLERHGLQICAGASSRTTTEAGTKGSSTPQAGSSSEHQQVGIRCKPGACETSCSQCLVCFDSVATLIQVVSFWLWKQSMLLSPLTAAPPASGQHDASDRQGAQGKLQGCTCSQLQWATAGLLEYRGRLQGRLADAVSSWEAAGYLGG